MHLLSPINNYNHVMVSDVRSEGESTISKIIHHKTSPSQRSGFKRERLVQSSPSFSSHTNRCSQSIVSPLNIINWSFFHSAPVLWNSLPSDLCHVAHHVTPSPILNSPVSDVLKSLFLEIFKNLFHCYSAIFLLSLYLPRLSQDWYLRYRQLHDVFE